MMANSTGLQPPDKPSSDSPWTGPDFGDAISQAIFCLSLLVTLLVAFAAVLAKQWLSNYSQDNIHASLINCGRDRQLKIDGMLAWRFERVMECLHLMVQLALLLICFAFCIAGFLTNTVVISISAFLVVSSFSLYIIFSIVSTVSNDCPFHTPLSHLSRAAIRFIRRHKYLGRYRRSFSQNRKRRRPQPGGPHRLTGVDDPDWNDENENDQLTTVGPPVLVDQEPDWEGYVLDSKGIAWMFKMSMDPDVILAIVKFIPKIVWHNDIQTTPLEKLYDTTLECIDNSSGSPVVAPKFRDKAYLSAKALVHLGIQRKCMGNESDVAVFASISRRHTSIGSGHYGGIQTWDILSAWWIASSEPATPYRCTGTNSPSLILTTLGWLTSSPTVHGTP